MQQIRLYAALAACLPLFAFAAPTIAGGPLPQTEAAIKAENARWADAFKRGDYQAIGKLYTDDGTLLQPGGDRVIGRAAISDYFTQGYAGKMPATVSFSDYEFYGNDQVVTEVSNATIRDQDGELKLRAKQTLIFLKQGGVWKLHRDMWNDNGPLKPDDH